MYCPVQAQRLPVCVRRQAKYSSDYLQDVKARQFQRLLPLQLDWIQRTVPGISMNSPLLLSEICTWSERVPPCLRGPGNTCWMYLSQEWELRVWYSWETWEDTTRSQASYYLHCIGVMTPDQTSLARPTLA